MLNNIPSLAPLVGLVGKNVESAAPYFKSGRKTGAGVQIDYLVQLPRCTYIIEIKRKNRIGKEIEDELEQKLERLKLPRNRSVKIVLLGGSRGPLLSPCHVHAIVGIMFRDYG